MPIPQNINYADYLAGIKSPMESALQGFQGIRMMQDIGRVEAEKEQAQFARESMQRMQGDLAALAAKDKATSSDYISIMTKYPELSQHLKTPFEAIGETEKRNIQKQALNVFSAINTGQIDVAKSLLEDQITASENTNDKASKDAATAMLKLVEANPQAAKASSGLLLASTMDEKEFSDILQKMMGFTTGQTNETDIDDYVRDAQIAWRDETGTDMPAAERNKARLEFKRAQAKEVKANRIAEKEVDASTAERIAFNSQLGTRLAQITTAADLIKAKGEITPVEKSTAARTRMESNLAKLSRHYLNLDSQGGIINTDKNTLNNIWARTKASAPGQAFQNAMGTDEQSVRNAIQKLKPLLIQDIRQATNMSARGLDSEKELEFYLKAATDEKSDLQSNIAAIVVMSEAYGDGKLAKELREAVSDETINTIANKGQAILNQRAEKPKPEVPLYLQELGIQ